MIYILVSLVLATILTIALFLYCNSGYKPRHSFAALCACVLGLCTGLAAALFACNAWGWFAAKHQANIINREYGTHYTQAEVFWASDVIETVRELDRKRVEVNGNLITGDAK